MLLTSELPYAGHASVRDSSDSCGADLRPGSRFLYDAGRMDHPRGSLRNWRSGGRVSARGPVPKRSWEKQAGILVNAGFRALAIDLRGFGLSKEGPKNARSDFGSPLDVLAAVRYLHANRTKTVSIIGASMGGDAAEGAVGEAKPGEIDRIVLLAHGAYGPPEKLKGRKLFIVSRNDVGPGDKPRPVRIREQYEKAPAPKKLVILDGAAHAQFIFETDQAARLMHEILTFLSER